MAPGLVRCASKASERGPQEATISWGASLVREAEFHFWALLSLPSLSDVNRASKYPPELYTLTFPQQALFSTIFSFPVRDRHGCSEVALWESG